MARKTPDLSKYFGTQIATPVTPSKAVKPSIMTDYAYKRIASAQKKARLATAFYSKHGHRDFVKLLDQTLKYAYELKHKLFTSWEEAISATKPKHVPTLTEVRDYLFVCDTACRSFPFAAKFVIGLAPRVTPAYYHSMLSTSFGYSDYYYAFTPDFEDYYSYVESLKYCTHYRYNNGVLDAGYADVPYSISH